MKAVIVTGGKQYTVAEGDVLYIEKLAVEAEATVKFDQVLAVLDGENTKIGTTRFWPFWMARIPRSALPSWKAQLLRPRWSRTARA